MTPLEKLVLATKYEPDAATVGKVTLGELRAYAEELRKKPLVSCETCANALDGRTTDEIQCNYWLLENPSAIKAWYLPKVMRISCSHYIPRPKKVMKAQWIVSIKTPGFFTPAEAKERFGDRVLKPVEESWKEVEDE